MKTLKEPIFRPRKDRRRYIHGKVTPSEYFGSEHIYIGTPQHTVKHDMPGGGRLMLMQPYMEQGLITSYKEVSYEEKGKDILIRYVMEVTIADGAATIIDGLHLAELSDDPFMTEYFVTSCAEISGEIRMRGTVMQWHKYNVSRPVLHFMKADGSRDAVSFRVDAAVKKHMGDVNFRERNAFNEPFHEIASALGAGIVRSDGLFVPKDWDALDKETFISLMTER